LVLVIDFAQNEVDFPHLPLPEYQTLGTTLWVWPGISGTGHQTLWLSVSGYDHGCDTLYKV